MGGRSHTAASADAGTSARVRTARGRRDAGAGRGPPPSHRPTRVGRREEAPACARPRPRRFRRRSRPTRLGCRATCTGSRGARRAARGVGLGRRGRVRPSGSDRRAHAGRQVRRGATKCPTCPEVPRGITRRHERASRTPREPRRAAPRAPRCEARGRGCTSRGGPHGRPRAADRVAGGLPAGVRAPPRERAAGDRVRGPAWTARGGGGGGLPTVRPGGTPQA